MERTTKFFGTLTLLLALLFSLPVVAQEHEAASVEQRTVVDAMQALTYPEIDQILLEVQNYQLQNPDASEEDLNRLASTLVTQQVKKLVRPMRGVRGESWYPLPESVFGLNPIEQGLCVFSPLKCLKVYSCSNKARTTAPAYFKDGCTNGRCDAFRHAYWNALMVRRIDYNFARDFAAAHEAGAKNNIGTLAFQMDVWNNAQGQYIGQNHSTSKYTETQVEGVVKKYVLDGKLMIIKNNRVVKSNQ